VAGVPLAGADAPAARAPRLAEFDHYCLDQGTAETLAHAAEAARAAEPCLLEGETSASKTSALLYLAALLGRPVARVNLNGQTETGELLGRFAPAEGGGWAWRDGVVVEALRQGWWLILDELNLAEPQVLERLNSLLERAPTLTLTERDHRVFAREGGDEPLSPHFRVFATMNPAEYAGRSALSPAYRDRWLAYRFTPPPAPHHHEQLLRALIWGEQPAVTLSGVRYQAPALARPPLRALAAHPRAGALCEALARAHAALSDALSGEGAGLGRRERPVFTRRGLLAVADALARAAEEGAPLPAALAAALDRYYLGRLADEEDRAVALSALEGAGLRGALRALRGES